MIERDRSWRHLSALILCFSILISASLMDAVTNPTHAQIQSCYSGVADDVTVGDIEKCAREFGHSRQLFWDGKYSLGAHYPDFSCESGWWFLFAGDPKFFSGTVEENAAFCSKVATAHKNIYGYRPYWENCKHPDVITDTQLQACIKGRFRVNTQAGFPSGSLSDRPCPGRGQYFQGLEDASLDYTGKYNQILGLIIEFECARVGGVLANIISLEADPCFADTQYSSNQVDFFGQCMGPDLNSTLSCRALQDNYLHKLIKVNGGIPPMATSDQQRFRKPFKLPNCREIQTIQDRLYPDRARVDEVPAITSSTMPEAAAPVEAEDGLSKSSINWPLTIFIGLVVIVIIGFLVPKIFRYSASIMPDYPHEAFAFAGLTLVILCGAILWVPLIANWGSPADSVLSLLTPVSYREFILSENYLFYPIIVYVCSGIALAIGSLFSRFAQGLGPEAIFIFLGVDHLRILNVVMANENSELYKTVSAGDLVTWLLYETIEFLPFVSISSVSREIIPTELVSGKIDTLMFVWGTFLFGSLFSVIFGRLIFRRSI